MNWFLHNFIADMPGPMFALVYLMAAAATAFWCWWRVRNIVLQTEATRPEPFHATDPHRVAYLRGGTVELLRLIVIDLVQRGYLRLVTRKLVIFSLPPLLEVVTPSQDTRLRGLARSVYYQFEQDSKAKVFEKAFVDTMTARCTDHQAALEKAGLLSGDETKTAARSITWKAIGLLLALGGYKLIVAMIKEHHNVSFLFMIAILGSWFVWTLGRVPRITRRGREVIADLQSKFEKEKRSGVGVATSAGRDATVRLFAVYGMSVLANTRLSEFQQYFQACAPNGVAGDGGCGGGGCGGGGCGGGCGGCGS